MADHSRVIQFLQQEREARGKQAAALRSEVEYKQAQIDYDLTHEHSSKAEVPRFERDRDEALHRLDGTIRELADFDEAIAVLEEDA